MAEGDSMEASAKSVGKPLTEDVANVAPGVLETEMLKDASVDVFRASALPNAEVKKEVDNENPRGNLNVKSSPEQNKSYDDIAKISKVNDVVASSLQSSDHKAHDAKRTSEAGSDCHTAKLHNVTGDPCQVKPELEGSDGEVQKSSVEFKHSGFAEEQTKLEGTSLNSPALTSQRKMVVSVGKSSSSTSNTAVVGKLSSSTSNTVVSKSSASENLKSADAQNSNLNSKQRVTSDSNANIKKDREVSDVVRDEDKHDVSRKAVREHSKSVNSVSKVSSSSRISHATVLKRTMSDTKDSAPFSSSKSPPVQSFAITSGSGESAGSLQIQHVLHAQSKMSTSTLPLHGEKLNQSNFQQPPKVNHAPLTHPPAASNSPATLSDEEVRVEALSVLTRFTPLPESSPLIFSLLFLSACFAFASRT